MPSTKAPPKASKYLKLFNEFVKDLRIKSKEESATDERGTKLVLWESQKRALNFIGQGLDDDIHNFYLLKSRQLGITTVTLAIDLFWAAMHPGLNGCIVTETDKNRDRNRQILAGYVDSFPEGYFGEEFVITANNRQVMRFSNGSQFELLVAGIRKKASTSWAEGSGYTYAHLTEVASYGDVAGLESLEESFAQTNPQRVVIYESTAKGMNFWRDRYLEGQTDPFTKRSSFCGWWGGDTNRVERGEARFAAFGNGKPSPTEQEKIEQVKTLYGWDITPEQLAWIRWKNANPSADVDLLAQNQPWTAEEAFVQTGYSFFQTRIVGTDIQSIHDAPELEPGEPGSVAYLGYCYDLTNAFFDINLRPCEEGEEPELRVWEPPDPTGKYVIGFDPAWGRTEHGDRSCLSDDSEILTDEGWKRHEDVRVGDSAVCFNTETGAYSYGAVSDVIVKDYAGDMLQFTGKGLDCLVTPDHRMVSRVNRALRDGRKQNWNFRTAAQLADAGRTWRDIPTGRAPIGSGVEDLSLDMCRAIGWILTDGHVARPEYQGDGRRKGQKQRRHYIHVVQAVTTNKGGVFIAEEMRRVFSRLCPTSYMVERDSAQEGHARQFICRINVKEAEQFMFWLGETPNRIPRVILRDGSRDQIGALFLGICEGDGAWTDNWGYTVVCPGLDWDFASDIQELASRLGYSASIARAKGSMCNGKMTQGQWTVRLAKRRDHTFMPQNVKRVPYDGKVWCVTVPTGAFVARRGGKMFVTGNCISIWRCYADKLIQVAEYATADVELIRTTWVLAHLAGAYRDCVVNIELNGPGRVVMVQWAQLLAQMQDKASQVTEPQGWEDALGSARWYLYHKPDTMGAGYAYNTDSSQRQKTELMHNFRGHYVTRDLVIKSLNLLKEMLRVIQDGYVIGAPESSNGDCKDDRVFAAAYAIEAWLRWRRISLISEGYTYDRAMKLKEQGPTNMNERINQVAYGFIGEMMKRQAEADPRPGWKVERGLA